MHFVLGIKPCNFEVTRQLLQHPYVGIRKPWFLPCTILLQTKPAACRLDHNGCAQELRAKTDNIATQSAAPL